MERCDSTFPIVKDGCSIGLRWETSGIRPAKTREAISMKLKLSDYVGDMTSNTKFGHDRPTGGVPAYMQHITLPGKVTFFLLVFSLVRSRPGRISGPIFTHSGSKCALCDSLRPSGHQKDQLSNFTAKWSFLGPSRLKGGSDQTN